MRWAFCDVAKETFDHSGCVAGLETAGKDKDLLLRGNQVWVNRFYL